MERQYLVKSLGLLMGGILLLAAVPGLAVERPMYDHVHVIVEEGPSPFLSVSYAVRTVDGQPVVIQAKQYPFVPVFDNRVEVVSRTEFSTFMESLVSEGALDLKEGATKAPFSLQYKVDIHVSGRSNSFSMGAPGLMEDPRYARVLETVVRFVEKKTGPAYFRDLVHAETKLGLLDLMTLPPVQVDVDGLPTGKSTPLYGFELGPGPHTAHLHNKAKGISRQIKFTIYEGEITRLKINIHKDLRKKRKKAK